MSEYFTGKNILITGGLGFIGLNLIDQLILFKPKNIVIFDNDPTKLENIDDDLNKNVKIILGDILEIQNIEIPKIDMIFHLAAQTSVPFSVNNPESDFNTNVVGSFRILEYARKNGIKELIFASSGGTVYGETQTFPTPEDQSLSPISNYGASKAAIEMFVQSYSFLYNMKITTLRLGNIFGPRSIHGVIFDFFIKLKNDNTQMEILGDGLQNKSYLYIDDCISAILITSSRDQIDYQAYNISYPKQITVNKIAKIVCDELGFSPKFYYTGGKRGWEGDVIKGSLDVSKITNLGWEPKNNYQIGISKYINWLLMNF